MSLEKQSPFIFSFGQRPIRRGKIRNIYEILMMLVVHQLLCERSSILSSPLLSVFSSYSYQVLWPNNRRVPHILPKTKFGQPGRSARSLLLQIRKTNSVLVQLRGELAALARRSHELPPKSPLHYVAEIVVKMKKCTFLESNFQLASCKSVDDFQMRTPADHGSR